jgi:multidrug transporter EmrE-like cation transporter
VFFLVLVLAQVYTGYDFSAAYAMLGGFGGAELALSAIIKHGENKQEHRYRKDDKDE